MTRRTVVVIILGGAALLTFFVIVRNLSLGSLAVAANDDVHELLQQSLEDQKELARAYPAKSAHYRARFDALRRLSAHLDVMALTRARLTRRLESTLLLLVAAMFVAGGAIHLADLRARERRLRRLQSALEALSRGQAEIATGERGRDVIGRISRMIEETARTMAGTRRRVQSLEHLSAWQEAARRHAHEINTPLTAAQLELGRMTAWVAARLPDAEDEIRQAEVSILEELEQLRRFTTSFVSLAAIRQPRLVVHDVAALVEDFAVNFEPMWPRLRLSVGAADGDCRAALDRDMVRQVLVNLCNNSAHAGSANLRIAAQRRNGLVAIDVSDDGPGVSDEVRTRLFEPYTTTRAIGDGMGLGLSISKKIMLDHGGDLEWLESTRGATFRMTFPAAESGS
jgi:two-component system, NtrC family, nitrogen regulation sensor histidine kinase NtrY